MRLESDSGQNNKNIKKSPILDRMIKSGITPNHITVAGLVAALGCTVGAIMSSKPELVVLYTAAFAIFGKGPDYLDGKVALRANEIGIWGPGKQGEIADPLADKLSVYIPNSMMSLAAIHSGDTMAGVVMAVSTILLFKYDWESTLARGMPDWKILKDTLQFPYPYPKLKEEDLISTKNAANIFGKSKAAFQGVGSVSFMLYPLMEWFIAVGGVAYTLACISSLLSKQQKDKNNSR